MERKAIVSITLTAVFAIVIIAVSLAFVIPFLRFGEIPLFSGSPFSGEFVVSGSAPSPQPTETAQAETAAAKADQAAAAEKEAAGKAARYEEAMSLLFQREFSGAQEAFAELGDYVDSARWSEFALSYPSMEPEFGAPMIDNKYLSKAYKNGKLYSLSDYGTYNGNSFMFKGLFYIPNTIDNDTSFVQYYAGGGGGEDYLWYSGVYRYFDEYSPNAVIMFTNDSGSTYMHKRNAFQWAILSQLAYECGTVVRNVSTIASSQGSYTAMQFAYDFYIDYGIKVERCLTLDTGCDWSLDYLALSAEQCSVLAEAGTELYLFEDFNFKNELQYEAMQNIINSDLTVFAYVCKCNDHNCISKNAYSLDLFSFCAGADVELPECEYCKVELYPGITELGELYWPPRPESETRYIYGPVRVEG